MKINADVIIARLNTGERVSDIADDAGTQFLGTARVIAAELMNAAEYMHCIDAVKPEELHAETMLDGNVLVLWKPTKFTYPPDPGVVKVGHTASCSAAHAKRIISGWPKWKQKLCMLQARLRRK